MINDISVDNIKLLFQSIFQKLIFASFLQNFFRMFVQPIKKNFDQKFQPIFHANSLKIVHEYIIIIIGKTTNKPMATLRTAFMQTYHSSNPCFTFFSTLPCLLGSLLNSADHACSEEKEHVERKYAPVSCSFEKLGQILRNDKDRLMRMSTLFTTSLHEISDSNNSDFQAQRQQGSFVHALQLIGEDDQCPQVCDLKTVQSEVISIFGNDPNSTEISLSSDYQISDVEDL